MLEYSPTPYLDRLRTSDPEAFRKIIEQELLQARDKQVRKLTEFVRNKHLSLEQLANASCRQLREASRRFSVTTDTGDIFYEDISDPEEAKRKFLRVMGLVPSEEQEHIDPQNIRQIITRIIAKNNADLTEPIYTYNGRDYPRAEILAVVCGGSRFEEGKTPDEDSDIDIDVLYAKEGYFDAQDIKRLFQQELRRPVQMGSAKYTKYIADSVRLRRYERKIAQPFRCKHRLAGNEVLPLLNPRSLIVAKHGYEKALQILAPAMPPTYSEQPYGDIYYRPTETEFSLMGLDTTAQWYAEAVEKYLTTI